MTSVTEPTPSDPLQEVHPPFSPLRKYKLTHDGTGPCRGSDYHRTLRLVPYPLSGGVVVDSVMEEQVPRRHRDHTGSLRLQVKEVSPLTLEDQPPEQSRRDYLNP